MIYPVSWREDDQVSNVKMMNQAFKVLQMAAEYFFHNESIKKEYREISRDSYTCREITALTKGE